MILFSERQKLAKAYEKWREENPEIQDCPFNVISFLDANGLLDEKTVKEYMDNRGL